MTDLLQRLRKRAANAYDNADDLTLDNLYGALDAALLPELVAVYEAAKTDRYPTCQAVYDAVVEFDAKLEREPK